MTNPTIDALKQKLKKHLNYLSDFGADSDDDRCSTPIVNMFNMIKKSQYNYEDWEKECAALSLFILEDSDAYESVMSIALQVYKTARSLCYEYECLYYPSGLVAVSNELKLELKKAIERIRIAGDYDAFIYDDYFVVNILDVMDVMLNNEKIDVDEWRDEVARLGLALTDNSLDNAETKEDLLFLYHNVK